MQEVAGTLKNKMLIVTTLLVRRELFLS